MDSDELPNIDYLPDDSPTRLSQSVAARDGSPHVSHTKKGARARSASSMSDDER